MSTKLSRRCPADPKSTQQYSYPDKLKKFRPDMQPDLAADEMRITFLGTESPPPRLAQALMSIFVEVGPWMQNPAGGVRVPPEPD